VLHWDERMTWSGEYDLIVVQHFTRDYSVLAPVRARFPAAVIALRPDRPPEWEARHVGVYFEWLLRDLIQADVVLDAMPDGRRASFYAQLASKPWTTLLTPLVPHPDVEALRKRPREMLVGWLHPADPEHHLPTLATLAAVQRHMDVAVTVVNASVDDAARAVALGLDCEFIPAPSHEGFIDLLSRAKVVVDIFPMRTPARVASVAAYLGTPTVTATDTQDVGHPQVDAWGGDGAAAVLALLDSPARLKAVVKKGVTLMDRHRPQALRDALEQVFHMKHLTGESND
jgi:hypothetical protein